MSDNKQKGVTIITSTIRSSFINNLIGNFERQQWGVKELIIIVNNNSISLKPYQRKAAKVNNVRVYRMDQSNTLGACLNYGVSLANYDYIAKFDDDDYYSPYYIKEAMGIFAKKNADVVGKRTCFFFFPHRSKLLLRRVPLKASGRSNIIAGPTIMFHKRVFNKVSFSTRLYQGCDVHFTKKCLRKGYSVYTTSPYNFVSIRRSNRLSHTWKVSDQTLLSHRKAEIITTSNFKKYIIKPV